MKRIDTHTVGRTLIELLEMHMGNQLGGPDFGGDDTEEAKIESIENLNGSADFRIKVCTEKGVHKTFLIQVYE